MRMLADTIKLSPAQTVRIVTSSSEALELEATWDTGGKPPPSHWHPSQHEHFEVLEGELTVQLDGREPRRLGAGQALDIPPRTAHCMWNAGTEPARASWRVSPPQRTEEMFRRIGQGTSGIGRIWLLWTFRNEFRVGKKSPA